MAGCGLACTPSAWAASATWTAANCAGVPFRVWKESPHSSCSSQPLHYRRSNPRRSLWSTPSMQASTLDINAHSSQHPVDADVVVLTCTSLAAREETNTYRIRTQTAQC